MFAAESAGPSAASAEPMIKGKRVRWSLRLLLLGALLLIVLIAALPTLVTRTSLGRRLLRSQLARHGIRLELGSASLGWLSPAQLNDLQLTDEIDRWALSARQASSQRTLWQLLWSGGDFGEFRLEQPTVVLHAQRPWPLETPPQPPEVRPAHRRLRLVITQANVLIQTAAEREPTPFVQGANVTVDYEQARQERFVTMVPGRPLEHAQITPDMCDLALKYVLPVLTDVAWTRGALSLELDNCRIPLHDPKAAEVAGRLTVHSVESGLRESLARQIVQLAVNVRGSSKLPESLRMVDESVVSFRVHDGAVEHRDLAFGLPEVSPDLVIRTAGTVGMDGSLDLLIELPKAGELLGEGPLARTLQQHALRVPVRGTLDAPQLSLEGQGDLLGDVLTELGLPLLQDPSAVNDLLRQMQELRQQRRQRRETDDPDRPGLLRRLRDRRLRDADAVESSAAEDR